MGEYMGVVFTSLLEEVVHSMLSKIVSLACVALTAGQVQIEGSPEWQAYKNAELAHIAPSIGPLASVGRNFAQEQLNWQQQQLVHQQNALNFVGPAPGPTPVNFAQSALDFVGPAPGPTPFELCAIRFGFCRPSPSQPRPGPSQLPTGGSKLRRREIRTPRKDNDSC